MDHLPLVRLDLHRWPALAPGAVPLLQLVAVGVTPLLAAALAPRARWAPPKYLHNGTLREMRREQSKSDCGSTKQGRMPTNQYRRVVSSAYDEGSPSRWPASCRRPSGATIPTEAARS